MSVFVVTITMLISVPAAFALSRMKFWGSATLATGVFLTYLIPETLLFIPLFKMFAVFNELTGIQLINRWWVLLHPLSDADGAVLHLDHDRLLRLDPEGARRGGADRRRQLSQILTKIFIPVALPGHHRRDDLRLHGVAGRSSSIRSPSPPRPTSWCCRSASSPR